MQWVRCEVCLQADWVDIAVPRRASQSLVAGGSLPVLSPELLVTHVGLRGPFCNERFTVYMKLINISKVNKIGS